MNKRNLWGLLPLLVSVLFVLCLHLESPVWVLLQLGCTLAGAALEGLLVFLTRHESSPLRLLPLFGLLLPEALALRKAVEQSGFLWQIGVVMYLLLGLHYFLGFLGVWLLFYRRET